MKGWNKPLAGLHTAGEKDVYGKDTAEEIQFQFPINIHVQQSTVYWYTTLVGL